MKSFTPKLVVDNKDKDIIRDLSQFFYVKNSNITAENLEKLSEHFNTSIEKKVHPWSFEKNLDDQLKGADRVHFLYLYYLIYINAVHEDIFYGLLNDGCDGSYAKLFRRDEQNNPLALQVFKYNILGFNLINGSKINKVRKRMKKKSKGKLIVPKWLKRPMDTIYLKLFQKYVERVN